MPAYEELQSKIIKTGMCTVCGACISACPNHFIRFVDQKLKWPVTKTECEYCDKCYNACYVIRREFLPEIAKSIFGVKKREGVGIYNRIMSATTRQGDIKQVCQDGGIVTSLLIQAVKENFIDGALVTLKDGWMPVSGIAKTKEELISSAKTKYGVVPILKELRTAIVDHGLSRICVVGSPCHIQSLRYLQHLNMLLTSAVKLIIGLFCRENYEFHYIEDKLKERGLKTEGIQKFEISEEFNIWLEGYKLSFPITEVKNWVPKHCLVCEDFTNELADISVGKEGSPEGWSTVIVRTKEGESVFSRLEEDKIIEVKPVEDMNSIQEMADRKREQAKYTRKIFRLKEKGLGKPEIAAILGITDEITAKLRISEEWWLYRLNP